MSRSARLLEADACVQALDRAATRAQRLRLVGASDLSLIGALRTHLTLRVADAFEAPRAAHLDAKDALRSLATRFRKSKTRSRLNATDRPTVLVIPRQWNHFRDLTPVSQRLLGFGDVRPVWLLFQDAHTGLARDAGTEFVLAQSIADAQLIAHARLYAECARLRPATVPRPEGISDVRWRDTLRVARRYLPSQVPAALLAASALEKAVTSLKPAAIAVSHPCTLEAVVALACARAHSIPSICVQPSLVAASDPTWWPSPIDRLYAWGEESRRVLVERGFSRAAIEVTGPVWTDLVAPVRTTPSSGSRPRALIALSGPGHSISHDEHERLVRRILHTSSQLENFDFEYRLHPKDSPELWSRLLGEIAGSRGRVVPSSADREPIEARLVGAAVLVTVGSTAAVDALYAGVPVVTLARAGAPDAEFVGAGATTHVAPDDDLSKAILESASNRDSSRREAAEAYLGRLLGPRDGHAHERIASGIRSVVQAGVS